MQRPLVLNATPIMYLCKIGLSRVFAEIRVDKYTTSKVVEEVVDKGKSLGAPDAFVAEKLIEQSIIKVQKPRDVDFIKRLSKIPDLHEAEIQVLALAKELNGIAIIDESIAREVSRIFDVEAHGTAFLLLTLFYGGYLTREKVKESIERMVSVGWRLTAEEYAKLIKELGV